MTTVTVDSDGCVVLPKAELEGLGIEAGNRLFLRVDREHGVMHLGKTIQPCDGLADYAEGEYRAGRTRSLREYVRERGINLDDEV